MGLATEGGIRNRMMKPRRSYPPGSRETDRAQKSRMLAGLRARIVKELYLSEWREVWFFPPCEGVEGWRGTQRIMFVGLNPSTGRFPTDADRILYARLKANGFARAHLTDVIKGRAIGRDVDKIERDAARMERYRRYLRREVDITRPRLIVAMGKRAHPFVTEWLGSQAPVRRIPHYAARFPSSATRRPFTAKIAGIRREYERISASQRTNGRPGRDR